jgi:hypothetical protein
MKLNISRVISSVYIFFILVIYFLYILVESSSSLFSIELLLILTILTLVIIFFTLLFKKNTAGFISFFSILFFAYYMLPFLNLILFPDNFHRGNDISILGIADLKSAVLHTTIYLTSSVFILYFLFLLLSRVNFGRSCAFRIKYPDKSIMAIVAFYFTSLFFKLFSFLFLGVGRFDSNVEGAAVFIKLYYLLFDVNMTLIVLSFLSIIFWRHITKKSKKFVIIAIFTGVLVGMLTGSKAAIFYLFIYLLGSSLYLLNDIKIDVRKLMFYLVITLFLFLFSYLVGFVFRGLQYIDNIKNEIITLDMIFSILGSLLNDFNFEEFDLIRGMLGRVNAFDPLVVIVNHGQEPMVYQHFFTSLVNLLLPGNIYENRLPISQLYAVIYKDSSILDAVENYHTEIFYIFGILIPYIGNFFAFTLVPLFISLLYLVIRLLMSESLHIATSIRIYLISLFLYSFVWIFISMGIEELLYLLVASLVHIFVIAIFSFIFTRGRSYI